MPSSTPPDLTSFESVVSDGVDLNALRDASPSLFDAMSDFWGTVMSAGHLSPRMRELLLLAMHASPTALDAQAVRRQVGRAQQAGATHEEILDVLFTVAGVANHALYFALPILEEELEAAGLSGTDEVGDDPALEALKAEFLAARGFWNSDRNRLARLMPEYFRAVNRLSTESWKNGALDTKEREFVCIAIDSTVTHNYEPGLRLHIGKALGLGATPAEILEIFQLTALVGVESYILGGRALFGTSVGDWAEPHAKGGNRNCQ